MRHDVAQHEQIVVGLVVGDHHAALLFVGQRFDVGLDPQTQDAHGRPGIEAGAQAAVVRIERSAQAQDHTQPSRDHKMQAHQ
ncbi:hypothetical protein D3C71_2067680 [compost metagenome]